MKVQYSKVLLSGIIASTFFMVSCQKKGSARGIVPQAIQKTTPTPETKPATDQSKDTIKTTVESKTTDEKPTVATADSKTDQTKTDGAKADKKTDPATTDTKPTVPPVAPTTPAAPSKTPDVPAKTDDDSAKPKVEEKVEEKKEALSSGKVCSKEILNSAAYIYREVKKINNLSETKQLELKTSAERIQMYTDVSKECTNYKKIFTDLKAADCMANQTKVEPTRYDVYCENINKRLDFENYRNEKLVISETANQMFLKENLLWKMFLVSGKTETDSRTLPDVLESGKMACTFGSDSTSVIDLTNKVVKITGLRTGTEKDTNIDKAYYAEFALSLAKVNGKDEAKSVNLKLFCASKDQKSFSIKAVKESLGQALASPAPKTSEVKPTVSTPDVPVSTVPAPTAPVSPAPEKK